MVRPCVEKLNQKRKDTCYVIYHRCYSHHIVAHRVSHFLHHGWFHSRSSGDRDCGHLGQRH